MERKAVETGAELAHPIEKLGRGERESFGIARGSRVGRERFLQFPALEKIIERNRPRSEAYR